MSTTTTKQLQEQRKYGLLSMISLIVGVVIGSGIFFKNRSMADATQSAVISLSAWLVVALIVAFMTIAFIEIASSTSKSGEVGSYGTWGDKFIGPKTGKYIELFFTYIYMPTLYLILALVAGEMFFEMIYVSLKLEFWEVSTVALAWMRWAIIFIFGIILILGILWMNTRTSKPGKILQVTGTALKIVPLLLISILGILAAANVFGSDYVSVLDPDKNPAFQDENTWGITKLLMFALPAAMFSFDGFTHAATMQNEAKTKNTFKNALIISVVFIVGIYLISSWAVFYIGGEGVEYTVQATVREIFDAEWVYILMSLLIVISVITGLSGNIIFGNRQYASLSEKNYIADTNGEVLRRNKAGVPYNAAKRMSLIALMWMLYLFPMDALSMWGQVTFGGGEITNFFAATEYKVDIATVGAFIVYTMIMIGALRNRKTKSVEVEEVKGFVSSTIVASVMMSIIAVFMVGDILNFEIFHGNVDPMVLINDITKLLTTIVMTTVLIVVYKRTEKEVDETTISQFRKKEQYVDAFQSMMTMSEYKEAQKIKKKRANTAKAKRANTKTKAKTAKTGSSTSKQTAKKKVATRTTKSKQ